MFTDDNIRLQQSTIQMAIRMAINEHGLQQTDESTAPPLPPRQEIPRSIDTTTGEVPPIQSSSSNPLATPIPNESDESSSGLINPNQASESTSSEIPKQIAVAAFSHLEYDDDDELDAVEDFAYEDFSDGNSEPDHSNFLEAAVAAAIQKKGLSSSSSHSSSSATG